ncbi:hypothetical protein ZEAMMB73_Zm00001d027240 [Zea mays]|uniref:Uncharacterized protein n=1 Tax=Zea mays TaxID=4577 RepID=A0A1D6JJ86_MAIZE|nr:hypothetical protein ZEAMMB73_Zm00001d027240 [Zea mays]
MSLRQQLQDPRRKPVAALHYNKGDKYVSPNGRSWRSSSRLPNFSTPLSSRAAASWVSSCSTSRLAQLRQQRRHRHCQHQLPMPSRPAIL